VNIEDPRQRWVFSRFPALNPVFAIVECFWILAGRDDAAFLTPWNSKLPAFVGSEPTLHGAYGARLRRRFGLDQLELAYQALRHNESSRQVVLQIWDPRDDLPVNGGMPRSHDIPCNICASLKVRDGRLHWLQVMRSNDFFRGFPYNLVQFTVLQEVMAGWLGLGLGGYTHVVDSLHIYEKDLDGVRNSRRLDCDAGVDSLAVPKDQFDLVLPLMIGAISACAESRSGAVELRSLVDHVSVPNSYRNLLWVVAAESARRRRWLGEAEGLINSCSNPVLVALWQNWTARFDRPNDGELRAKGAAGAASHGS
jgi:thymidylate synthase